MFKHILLPTDGSPLSKAAIRKGIQFAKTISAKVTGFCVTPLMHDFSYESRFGLEFTEQAKAAARAQAAQNLLAVETAAKEAGVVCDTVQEKSDYPYEAIMEAAHAMGCDLIVMASHGRRGVGALLLGSETQKVLTHSKIPVLVCR
jgi:nucleotide-binding universal stress UspA family protein